MSVLEKICDDKRVHVAQQKEKNSLVKLREQSDNAPAPLGFIQSLKNCDFPAIITEVKKASPSKGIIREDFNPQAIAQTYIDNGAACLSVLTDTPYFQGSDEIFTDVREISTIPMLRKDFMIDPYQIYESRALGADCILIIMAALEEALAKDLHDLSIDLGMDVLVEVHNREELDRALIFSPAMVGVNNRNLKTLEVDIQTSVELAKAMPANTVKIAESGLKTHQNLQALSQIGYDGFLIGESLMREPEIDKALHAIRGKT